MFKKVLIISALLCTSAFGQTVNTMIKAEPKIKDAFLSGSVLYVGVLSDGRSRNGFATYICDSVKDHNIKASKVRVVDVAKIRFQDKHYSSKDVLLGEANCK